MIFSVTSPIKGQAGCTTASLMLVHALALTQRKEVCLTHIDYGSPSILSALGVEPSEDITRSLSHIAKMLNHQLLKPDEVPDYAIKVFRGLDIYSTHHIDLEEYEVVEFFGNLIKSMTHYHHTVIDVDLEVSTENSTVKALEVSDIIIIPVTQNKIVLEEAIKHKQKLQDILEDIKGKKRGNSVPIYFMLNMYRSDLMSIGKVAKKLGVPKKKILTLEYNPYFIVSSNRGRLTDLFASSLNNDPRALKLKYDMKRTCKSILGKEFMWEVDNKKKKAKDNSGEGGV